jgi:transposase
VEDVSEAFGVSRSSCYRWRQILEEHGTIKRPPSPLTGRTRTITRALLSAIQDLFAVDADLFLDEACTWLAFEHNIIISLSTLSRTLEQAGLTRKILQKLAAERDDIRREEFQASLHDDFIGDGSEFVVLDETSKNERTYARHYGRAPRGQRAQLTDVFVRGDRYSLCAAMTVEGYIAARAIEGSFDGQEFYDFVVEEVVSLHDFSIFLFLYNLLLVLASPHDTIPRRAFCPCS